MGEYFKNKYRVNSVRMKHWNYAWPAMYYVTICTKNRLHCLADIKNEQVYLSKIGNVAFDCWIEISKHFDNVKLDDWIIMPDHLHGIIVIEANDFGHPDGRGTTCRTSTVRKFGYCQPKSLSSIVGSFKGAVTNKCHKNNLDFQWQSNFYEHVIRDFEDLGRIREYIAHNPVNWENSKNNPNNF